jgi:hypothetical protein
MINATKDLLVFIQTGEQLNNSIIASLKLASKWILQSYGLENLDLERVNTKSYKEAIVPALVAGYILRNRDNEFTEDYVLAAYELVSAELNDIPPSLYSQLTIAETYGKRAYRISYLKSLRRGFSAFLIALHTRRAIVLPHGFTWPLGLHYSKVGTILSRREICPLDELPELLRFVRSLDHQDEEQSATVFKPSTRSERKRFSYYALHIIIATGWLTLEDANYDDLVVMYEVNEKNPFSHCNLACYMIADILEREYQSRSPITAAGWQAHLAKARLVLRKPDFDEALYNSGSSDTVTLEHALNIQTNQMAPENLEMLTRLPGLAVNVSAITKTWLTAERAYLRKVRRESEKQRILALGLLNTYLFGYLTYWLAAHSEFSYAFPDAPNKLLSAVFVSELGLLEHQNRPITLVEFVNALATKREWLDTTLYSNLKQIWVFFEFVERAGDQLPGCAGFQQPLSQHDFPPTTRTYGTTKRPIPRRVFKLFISYIEAIAELANVLLSRILSGATPESRMGLLKSPSTTLDCFELQDVFGFIPVLFHQGKTIPLRRIPNVLCVNRRRLSDGRDLRIPHPHSLHQILVALYTGLRHNHIQWLDAETFDCRVDAEVGKHEYAELHVNTDKVKSTAWQSHVNFRVIEILRAQLAWRQLIGEPGFSNKVFYNNNKRSKWGQFYALFADSRDGAPHTDGIYGSVWSSLLSGVQTMLPKVGENNLMLVRLLPSSISYDDPDQAQKLHEYGRQQKRVCRLMLKSDITPHSARVSVVSHAISILPADLIGRYWTGQTEATVYHYVVPDEGEINAEQQRQNLMLRQHGYEQGYEAMLAASPGRRYPFIKADDVNSRLAQSLQTDVEETIAAYGCVSLSLNGDTKTGLDVLRETRALGAVFNKTEICPYGNQCPHEVVVALKGFRRCGPCHFAVRSIEHVQAISAKIRQVLEGLDEVEARLDATDSENLTADEWDALAKNRDVLAEDLGAWQVSAEVLEVMRQRVDAGVSTKTWHIQRPEIIEQHLKRALFPTEATDYLLARLHESEAFPALESPQIRAKFDLLRRNLLANTGNIREALRMEQPTNPAAECRGLIRSIAAAHKLGIEDIRRMMDGGAADAIPARELRLLPSEIS